MTDDTLNSHPKEYGIIVVGALLFLFGFYIIAPVIHEMGHILMLKYYGCKYVAHLDIVILKSFYGKIYEVCELTKVQQLSVYLGGVILTFVLGFILMVIDIVLTRKRRVNAALLSVALAMSFFLNTSVYFFQNNGDIMYALQAVGLDQNFMPVVKLTGLSILGFMLLILGISLYHDLHLFILEWEENKDEWYEEHETEEKLTVWLIKNVEKIKNIVFKSSKRYNRKSRASRK